MIEKELKPRTVKGRVILKLKEEPSRVVTTSVPTGRRSNVVNLGIASVDKILANYGTIGITKLRGPPTESLPGGMRVRRVSEPETTHEAYGFTRTYIVKVPPETDLDSMVKKLKADPNVENAEVDYFARMAVVPNDRYYQIQWGLQRIRCEDAWELEKGSHDVIIAIVDTGVDQSHPDLVDKLVPGYDMVDLTDVESEEGCVWEGDIYTRDNNPEDENGHGTHCAGIAAASTNNGVGVAGVAWNCRVMSVRALANIRCTTDEGTYVTGTGTFTDIADGIIWAADHGAHVISMSLGGLVPKSAPPPSLLKNAIDYASSRGCVLVAAMGNDGVNPEDYNYYAYPAAHPKVLAVGAIDKDNRRASFSNYGDYKHVMAPGVDIRSAYIGSDYADMDGTSMATPFVSGLAALIKSADSHLSPEEIVETIRQTATSHSEYNIEYGYGVIDAYSAIKKIIPEPLIPTIDPCGRIVEGNLKESGNQKIYKIAVTNTLSINLDGPEGADFDLYLKKGAPPTTRDYDKRAYTVKPDETITHLIEEPGDYYVMVKSYRGAGDFKLTVRRE
ncbi:MAG: S8 family serine peptidase [Methanophagales archaeon]|nr:S8 family serine peptidase [Methanophagales archaeon]